MILLQIVCGLGILAFGAWIMFLQVVITNTLDKNLPRSNSDMLHPLTIAMIAIMLVTSVGILAFTFYMLNTYIPSFFIVTCT